MLICPVATVVSSGTSRSRVRTPEDDLGHSHMSLTSGTTEVRTSSEEASGWEGFHAAEAGGAGSREHDFRLRLAGADADVQLVPVITFIVSPAQITPAPSQSPIVARSRNRAVFPWLLSVAVRRARLAPSRAPTSQMAPRAVEPFVQNIPPVTLNPPCRGT